MYRPTGVCLMRLSKFRDEAQAYQFCPVCRYAVIDLLAPSKHGQNEDDCATSPGTRYSE